MFTKIILALSAMVAINAQAYTQTDLAREITAGMFQQNEGARGMFDFKVGDTASYKIAMGFFPGTMVMTVTDVQPNEVTINQVMNMLGSKQDCVQKMDPNTGESKSLTCNGQAQDQGDPNDFEVLEQGEDTVTVPAGTFTCLFIKARIKSSGEIVQQWINPSEVPVFGMVKQIQPSQMGEVTIELTSFKRMP